MTNGQYSVPVFNTIFILGLFYNNFHTIFMQSEQFMYKTNIIITNLLNYHSNIINQNFSTIITYVINKILINNNNSIYYYILL